MFPFLAAQVVFYLVDLLQDKNKEVRRVRPHLFFPVLPAAHVDC